MANNNRKELHILAVDDNVINMKIVEKLLISSSCKVTTSKNEIRALEISISIAVHYQLMKKFFHLVLMKQGDLKVNLIITDYCMPEMTGYELLKKIKIFSFTVILSSSEITWEYDPEEEELFFLFQYYVLKILY
ncbi:hypothetical protein M9H77_03161 [Catharanthus roseus]|uniref:Uncharacterized protein n=1 Tax=Catharanthus roseus TaxID=4058 RepID=A0ACC0CAW4_CATRO|nr:hypothetical protein M9H77_03161 [Catharanthus roseus]